MKIILVGASGDVGQAAFAELSQRHDIVWTCPALMPLQVLV